MTTFSSLGLSEQLLRGLEKAGYENPTPIQASAIPIALEGKDLTGCAQTGTGKTAAFVLPTLHKLLTTTATANKNGGNGRHHTRPVRALVITPTRELALQVEASVRTYGKFTRLRSITVYGGVSMEPQYRAFRQGVDVVIATPGRLLDHINRGSIDLSGVETLVVDEADRMFDMGFINDLRKIVAKTPAERQTLLFSATMPKDVQDLAASIQRTPEFIQVGERRNPADSVTQHFYRIAQDRKMDLLLHILRTEPVKSVLVFSKTKHRADRIAERLEKNRISAQAIHSNRTQNQRQRTLAGFKRGDFQVLVATDVAARGIDVDGISHVINFDTPNQAEDYIHRIGRTGRAQTTGDAMTFVSHEEERHVKAIERFTGKRFERRKPPVMGKDAPTTGETQAEVKWEPRVKPVNDAPEREWNRSENRTEGRDGRREKSRNGKSGQKRTDERRFKSQGGKSKARNSGRRKTFSPKPTASN